MDLINLDGLDKRECFNRDNEQGGAAQGADAGGQTVSERKFRCKHFFDALRRLMLVADEDQKEELKEHQNTILYVVMPDKDLTDMDAWEGQMIQLMKSFKAIVNTSTAVLNSRLESVCERLALIETKDEKHERLITMQINQLGEQQISFRKDSDQFRNEIGSFCKELSKTVAANSKKLDRIITLNGNEPREEFAQEEVDDEMSNHD